MNLGYDRENPIVQLLHVQSNVWGAEREEFVALHKDGTLSMVVLLPEGTEATVEPITLKAPAPDKGAS